MIAPNMTKSDNKSCVEYVCFRLRDDLKKEYLRKNKLGNWEVASRKEADRFTSKRLAREAILTTWTRADWRVARVTNPKYPHGPWSVYEDVFLAKMMRKCERCAYTEPLQSDKTRYARGYVLLDPSDCDPPHGLDLAPGSRDSLKVEKLEKAFRTKGFSKKKPALVGYPRDGRIQLVSGTHRHEAARRAGIMLPVKIMIRSEVEAIWGTPQWEDFLKDIPVEKLERVPVKEPTPAPGLDERVDLSRDLVLETADGRCGATYGGSGSCSLEPEHGGSHYCEPTGETFTASRPSEALPDVKITSEMMAVLSRDDDDPDPYPNEVTTIKPAKKDLGTAMRLLRSVDPEDATVRQLAVALTQAYSDGLAEQRPQVAPPKSILDMWQSDNDAAQELLNKLGYLINFRDRDRFLAIAAPALHAQRLRGIDQGATEERASEPRPDNVPTDDTPPTHEDAVLPALRALGRRMSTNSDALTIRNAIALIEAAKARWDHDLDYSLRAGLIAAANIVDEEASGRVDEDGPAAQALRMIARRLRREAENRCSETARAVSDTKETNATESCGEVVGPHLSWRDVLDCKIWYGMNYKMAKVADGAGYKYFVWNDRVYEIIKSKTKFDWEDRGIVSDLVK